LSTCHPKHFVILSDSEGSIRVLQMIVATFLSYKRCVVLQHDKV
jgi:hypothetical protein